jgi:hypothetical protein
MGSSLSGSDDVVIPGSVLVPGESGQSRSITALIDQNLTGNLVRSCLTLASRQVVT